MARDQLNGIKNKGVDQPIIYVQATDPVNPPVGSIRVNTGATVTTAAAGVSQALAIAYAVAL